MWHLIYQNLMIIRFICLSRVLVVVILYFSAFLLIMPGLQLQDKISLVVQALFFNTHNLDLSW